MRGPKAENGMEGICVRVSRCRLAESWDEHLAIGFAIDGRSKFFKVCGFYCTCVYRTRTMAMIPFGYGVLYAWSNYRIYNTLDEIRPSLVLPGGCDLRGEHCDLMGGNSPQK